VAWRINGWFANSLHQSRISVCSSTAREIRSSLLFSSHFFSMSFESSFPPVSFLNELRANFSRHRWENFIPITIKIPNGNLLSRKFIDLRHDVSAYLSLSHARDTEIIVITVIRSNKKKRQSDSHRGHHPQISSSRAVGVGTKGLPGIPTSKSLSK